VKTEIAIFANSFHSGRCSFRGRFVKSNPRSHSFTVVAMRNSNNLSSLSSMDRRRSQNGGPELSGGIGNGQ